MKNLTGIFAFGLLIVGVIIAAANQIISILPGSEFVTSLGAVGVGIVALFWSPRGLAIFTVIAGIILTFWNYLAAYGL